MKRLIVIAAVLCAEAISNAADSQEVWDTRVAPILDRYCSKCHAGVRQKSGLDLRSLDTVLRGGERGPEIVPAKPEESRLLQFIRPEADPHMPPEGKKQLGPEEIDTLRQWISNLPPVRTGAPASWATNNSWVAEYLVQLRRSEQPRFSPPAEMLPSAAIDAILQADWCERKIEPAANCSDRVFARRIYLDLDGRIPTPEETQRFLKNPDPNRRALLVSQLLKSDEYPRHMRDVFDVVLLGRARKKNDTGRRDHGWYGFLEWSFRTNRPWNEMVRDMILARATNAPVRGAAWYLYERKNNYQAMAEAVAPVVFGVQVACAQCHNHPLAWEIEQRHYWGLVAAFNRTKNCETASGIGVAESAVGGFVQFANLKKESQPAVLTFLNGRTVSEKRPAENEKETDRPDLYLIPPVKDGQKPAWAAVPKFSRRAALADAVTQGNPMLARAFVNRMWQLLVGRGIVHPVDQMDSRHRPSVPVLLNWLAADFERNGYNIQRLITGIVLSRAYQAAATGSGRSTPPAGSFARAIDKPLSAEQLLGSLLVATGNQPAGVGKAAGHDFEELRAAFIKKFPELMPAVYNPSLEQALFWSNSPLIDDLLRPRPGNTAARLLALGSLDERIGEAFSMVLGRAPGAEERAHLQEALAAETPDAGIKNLLWTLVAGAEFQLND